MSYELLSGHVFERLAEIPDKSLHSCVTSPPFYSARDYQTEPQVWGYQGSASCRAKVSLNSLHGRTTVDPDPGHQWEGEFCRLCAAWRGELGREPTVELFIEHLVQIFRVVREKLRDDGVCFVNIGDNYARNPNRGRSGRGKDANYLPDRAQTLRPMQKGIPEKSTLLVPQRLAVAFQDDGWIVRQDVIWGKAGGNCGRCGYRIERGNTRPEGVKDRFVRAHEHVIMLVKSKKYWYDREPIREPTGALRRDVLYITSDSFRGAHYAVMPIELAETLVQCSTPPRCCAACGAPYKRITRKGKTKKKWQQSSGSDAAGSYTGESQKDYESHGAEDASDLKRKVLASMKEVETLRWEATCGCEADVVPGRCLDPFSGAGTTGVACLKHDRDYIGIDLLESNNTEIAGPRLEAVLEAKKPEGDLSYLSPSEIYHGDALLLLPRIVPGSVRLVLTDPPYNTSRTNNFHTMGRGGIDFSWDGDFDQQAWIVLADRALMPGGSMVIWNDWKVLGQIAHFLMDLGYDVKRPVCLRKTNPMPRNRDRSAVQRIETGLWAVKPGAKWVFNRRVDKPYEDLIFDYPIPRAKKGRPRHETKKPDGMFEELITIFSNPGELILDPFCGGGTTPYAAYRLRRQFICVELEKKWWDESRAHLQDAALGGGRVPFEDLPEVVGQQTIALPEPISLPDTHDTLKHHSTVNITRR